MNCTQDGLFYCQSFIVWVHYSQDVVKHVFYCYKYYTVNIGATDCLQRGYSEFMIWVSSGEYQCCTDGSRAVITTLIGKRKQDLYC